MLKTTITPSKLNDLRQALDGNDLYDYLGAPPTKLFVPMTCPITRIMVDYGHLVEGLGYVSKEGLAIMLIRGLIERVTELTFPEEAAPTWTPSVHFENRIFRPVEPVTVEPLIVDSSIAPLSLTDFGPGYEAEPIDFAPLPLPEPEPEPEPEPVAKVEPVPPGLILRAAADSSRFRGKTYFVPKGAKVNVMELPPGTILEYEQDAPADTFDRTPVGKGFDLRTVPTMDRDLLRYEGDPDVGPAVVRKFAGEIRFDPPATDPSLTGEEGELFSGYKPGTVIFRNAGDVARYEASHGDPELMAALAAQDLEELGEETITSIKREDGVGMLRTSKGTKEV